MAYDVFLAENVLPYNPIEIANTCFAPYMTAVQSRPTLHDHLFLCISYTDIFMKFPTRTCMQIQSILIRLTADPVMKCTGALGST